MKKKIIALTLSLFVLPTFFSCSDFLDKESDEMLTLEMVFNDKKKMNEWLARVYTDVQDPLWSDMRNAGTMSDDFQPSLELSQFGWGNTISAMLGSWTTTSMKNYWDDFYKAIRTGYIFIDNAKPLPDQGLSAEDVEFMKHEVRYLIAYYYVYLMQLWGPVPLVTSQLSSSLSPEEMMYPRKPLDEMADWLDNELVELANFFPEKLQNESSNFGRPTKGACLALRARMWTWMASPLFNGNPYYADVKNPDGTPLFPQSYDGKKWQKAAEANKAVIDLAEKGVYSLYKVYHPDTKEYDPFTSCQYLFLTSGDVNKEIIWARVGGIDKDEQERYFNPRSNGAYGSTSLTQNLVDEFRMDNGKNITDNNSGYQENDFTDNDIVYPNTTWDFSDSDRTPGLLVPEGTFSMWANREPRFYTTIRFHLSYVVGLNGSAEYANGQKDGRPSHDTPACGYHGRKYTDPNATPRTGYYGVNRVGIIFRLPEFYLNYAEALVENDPSNPDIIKYLNLVRVRGGIPELPSSLLGNATELKKHIAKENRVEFAMEGKYRYDYIRRWKLAESVFKSPIRGLNQYGYDDKPIGDPQSFYTRVSVMKRVFEEKMYLWPVRHPSIEKNANLVQNKGWD